MCQFIILISVIQLPLINGSINFDFFVGVIECDKVGKCSGTKSKFYLGKTKEECLKLCFDNDAQFSSGCSWISYNEKAKLCYNFDNIDEQKTCDTECYEAGMGKASCDTHYTSSQIECKLPCRLETGQCAVSFWYQRSYQIWLDKIIYNSEMKFRAVLGSQGCREKKSLNWHK